MLNVYEHNGELVSILKDGSEAMVISAKGDVSTVKKAELLPTSLVNGGIYHEKFLQAALGGLLEPPKKIKSSLSVYKGNRGVVVAGLLVDSKDFVRYGVGLPDKAFGPGAERLDDAKINKDKTKDYNRDKGKELMDEFNTLDSMDKPLDDGPEELQIADDEAIGNIRKLTIEWESPMENLSIEDIKSMFGEGQPLPDPDVIKVDTGDEKITRKKSWREKLNGGKMVKKAYYGPTPVMYHTCPMCQTMLVIDWKAHRDGKTIFKCPNPKCGYEALYEGSLPFQGVSGQSRTAGLSDKAQNWISNKIDYLMSEESMPRKQAIAVAYSMAKKKGYNIPKKKD